MERMPTLDWPALTDGFAALLLFLTLLERLRRLFTARGETHRLEALQGLSVDARAAADEARERSTDLTREQRHQWERVAERLEAVAEIQAAQTAALEHVLRRLDRLDPGATGQGRATRAPSPPG